MLQQWWWVAETLFKSKLWVMFRIVFAKLRIKLASHSTYSLALVCPQLTFTVRDSPSRVFPQITTSRLESCAERSEIVHIFNEARAKRVMRVKRNGWVGWVSSGCRRLFLAISRDSLRRGIHREFLVIIKARSLRSLASNISPKRFAAPSSGKATQSIFVFSSFFLSKGIVVCKLAIQLPCK